MGILIAALVITVLFRGSNCGRGTYRPAFWIDVLVFFIVFGVLDCIF